MTNQSSASSAASIAAGQEAAAVPAFDIAIVGGGLAGAIAARQLARQDRSVAVVDLHDQPRPDFRAEQLVGPQVGRLAELGLLGEMTRDSRPCSEAVNARRGRIVNSTFVEQYGVPYQAMVRGVRAGLPAGAQFIVGRVASVDNGPDLQRVRLASGAELRARLVIMATGMSSVLPKRLGIEMRMIRASHSLAVAFDVQISGNGAAGFKPLIYYGENARDGMDYLALFAMHDVIRANLFCYREHHSAWARAFCRDPKAELLAVMPGLSRLIGDFEITSPVQMRSNDLRVAHDPARDGVVLVGDAFQTPCPAAGTGIDRLLSDLDVLCGAHVPLWLSTPGMARDKIAAFYADPRKVAFDAECLRTAEYRRSVSTAQGLWWSMHRKQVFLRRQLSALVASRARSAPARHRMAPST